MVSKRANYLGDRGESTAGPEGETGGLLQVKRDGDEAHMKDLFKARFPERSAIEALSSEELAYEIAIAMNQKLPQSMNSYHLQLDRKKLVGEIAGAYGNDVPLYIAVMAGLEAAIRLGLAVEMDLPILSGTGPRYIYLTKVGRGITNSDAVTKHRIGTLQAPSLLDDSITQRVWSPFLRGDYEIAISYAFKRVEVEMREKGSYPNDYYGERLVKNFFLDFRLSSEPTGVKPKVLTAAEQFFIGTLGLYRNPATHLDNTIDNHARAMEVLLIANHQLHLVRGATAR